MDSHNFPHRRYNPLTGDWVLVSPHRTQRPWQGAKEAVTETRAPYDPNCYLCPGNIRANGEINPMYQGVYVFTNDYPALLPEGPEVVDEDVLYRSHSVSGTSRVMCYSPGHDLTLTDLSVRDIGEVIRVWREQTEELNTTYASVQIFENKGSVMGCSNPHPHGQIWASCQVPSLVSTEIRMQTEFLTKNCLRLLEVTAKREVEDQSRVVCQNEDWVWLIPYWAVWPFEILLLPRFEARRLSDLNQDQTENLAKVLKEGLTAYDLLFDTSFPYSMGWHQCPSGLSAKEEEAFTLHAHFYPPLLRSATIKKFMVGYEMLGESQRDLTPELAAERLRRAMDSGQS